MWTTEAWVKVQLASAMNSWAYPSHKHIGASATKRLWCYGTCDSFQEVVNTLDFDSQRSGLLERLLRSCARRR